MTIGKLDLLNCEDLFSEEDILCLKMKEQFIAYENQVSLAMIPFYQERREHLREQISKEKRDIRSAKGSKAHQEFLEKTLHDVETSLEKEKQEVQTKA